MDLSHEKIIFKANKRGALLFVIFLCVAVGLVIWGKVTMDLFFDPQVSYHSQQEFLESCFFLASVACCFMTGKAFVIAQFYVTETGIIRRYGISGKWSRINFDQIAAAAVCTINGRNGQRRKLTMVCLKHQLLAIPTVYTDESVGRVAVILANNNIPVYQNIEEARHAAATAGYVMKKTVTTEQLNNPFYVRLHYGIAWLPLFVAACLLVGGILNSHCGTQTDIVVYGTVISKKIVYGRSSSGRIILRSGQTEELFSVSTRFVSHVRIGDQVKVQYTQGCFGLGYDLDYTKLRNRN